MSKRNRTIQQMAKGSSTADSEAARRRRHPGRADRRARRLRNHADPRVKAALVVGIAVLVLGGLFYVSNIRNAPADARDRYPYEIAQPGPGLPALALSLPGTDGNRFDLGSHRGEMVLLYFQEGLMCQPCWDQIVDIEQNWQRFAALGINRMVSITSDPLDLLERKVKDEGIATPLLSDPDLEFSRPWQANLYGMMGTAMNGHTFVLVDGDGTIRWRADYGGPPKYTMFVPTDILIGEMREALSPAGSANA